MEFEAEAGVVPATVLSVGIVEDRDVRFVFPRRVPMQSRSGSATFQRRPRFVHHWRRAGRTGNERGLKRHMLHGSRALERRSDGALASREFNGCHRRGIDAEQSPTLQRRFQHKARRRIAGHLGASGRGDHVVLRHRGQRRMGSQGGEPGTTRLRRSPPEACGAKFVRLRAADARRSATATRSGPSHTTAGPRQACAWPPDGVRPRASESSCQRR